jgi:DNA-binding response OmpR family regulator
MQTFPKVTLLVVEDSDDLRHILARRLAAFVGKVLESSNGEEAIQLIRSRKVDLVLSDINMPVMSGLELLGLMRSEGFSTPFVFFSQSEDEAEVVKARELGAAEFLEKPCTAERLRTALVAALRSKSSASPL